MGHDQVNPITGIFNFLLFVLTFLFLILAVPTNYPFGIVYEETAAITAFFRIAIGLLMLFRVVRSFSALPLIFGTETSQSPSLFFPKGIYYFKILLCLFLILGLFTDIVAALLFLAFVIVFWKSRYFSIEEVYFQNTLFHLMFLGCGRYYALDSMLEIPPVLASSYLFNSFFLSNGLIMMSAGYEKMKSKLWRSGKGTSYFFNSPHLLKKRFHNLNKLPSSILVVLSLMVVFGEFILLFSSVHPLFLILTIFVLLGFSTSLFTVIDISFIGQVLTLNLLFLAALNLQFWSDIDFNVLWSFSTAQLSSPIVLFCIGINLLTLYVTLYYPTASKLKLHTLQKIFTGVTTPIGVFTEKHQYGFYIFRIINQENKKVLLDAFDSNGYPGPYQMGYPRYFQAAMYPVTDYCLAIQKYGPDTTHKRQLVIDLLYGAWSSLKTPAAVSLTLSVKKFEEDDDIASFTEQKWSEIGYCEFTEKGTPNWVLTQTPPIMNKTSRIV